MFIRKKPGLNKTLAKNAGCIISPVFAGLLIIAVMLSGIFPAEHVWAKNYDSYSSTGYSWYFIRNKNHEKAGGGIPQGLDMKKYKAFYMDTETDEKVIYLTFDCGYENGYTAKILDTLKKHKVKALFFVTKHYLETNPKLVKRMKREGHFVGNHTLNHPDMTKCSADKIISEIEGCAKLMKKLTGYDIDPYFRPPMGCYSKKSLKITKDLGYNTMLWSIAYGDYDPANEPGKNYVINHFEENYHKGAMALIHVISSSNCYSLDTVIGNLKKHGYRFETVDEFTQKEGKLKISCEDKVYDGQPAKIKVEKNTNKKGIVTYVIKDSDGNKVEKAVEPGTYTVTAKVSATRDRRKAKSNKAVFTIEEAASDSTEAAPLI